VTGNNFFLHKAMHGYAAFIHYIQHVFTHVDMS